MDYKLTFNNSDEKIDFNVKMPTERSVIELLKLEKAINGNIDHVTNFNIENICEDHDSRVMKTAQLIGECVTDEIPECAFVDPDGKLKIIKPYEKHDDGIVFVWTDTDKNQPIMISSGFIFNSNLLLLFPYEFKFNQIFMSAIKLLEEKAKINKIRRGMFSGMTPFCHVNLRNLFIRMKEISKIINRN